MINIQTIENVSDCVPLYLPQSLYLKPLAKFNISVALPQNKTGKSISNLEIMDKLSSALKPDKFLLLRVTKSTVEFLRFEAELESRKKLRMIIDRLDGISIRIHGFSESFRVRASETKDEFPTRHDWDAFFRDANNMDEMKPGERPDTIHLSYLPIRWFCPRQSENNEQVKPSESIFKRIFEKFGSVRCVDIPICDPFRSKMNTDINGMRTFSVEQDVLFEAYVQFDEYVGFVRAMDEFRGMKLVRKFVDKTQAINIKVTFDRTKHLSEASIMRRERLLKRLMDKARAQEEALERKRQEEKERLEREEQAKREKEEQQKLIELEKRRQREEARKEKHLKKIQERSEQEYAQKIRVEERKLKIAQRKLESIRILGAVFGRIQEKYMETLKDKPSTSSAANPERENARVRLVDKYKDATEKLVEEQKEKIKDMKSRTPLQGLLSTHRKKEETDTKPAKSAADTEAADGAVAATNPHLNPFKAMAAAASEWMESMGGMFPYMPGIIPGMAAPFRPPFVGMPRGMLTGAYRGMPRMRGGYFPRGRGRGGYDPHYSSYRHQTEEGEAANEATAVDGKYYPYAYGAGRYPRGRRGGYKRGGKDYYYSKKHSHRHHRSHSRSRSTSYSRSRSRSYERRHYSKRSRSQSSYSRSRSHSRSRSDKPSRKLVSTRRSRTVSYSSRSRSHSRSRRTRSRQHSSRRHSRRNSERSNSQRSSRRQHSLVLETDELVRDAEVIKRTIETEVQTRMREEEREIKRKFKPLPHNHQTNNAESHENANEHQTDSLEIEREREDSLENAPEPDERRSRSRSRSYVETKHRNDRRSHSRRSFSIDEED